ncbi:MAG: Hsp20/alpha crystallin family protein [Bacteroidetes bacterium]|nr:Hsp20/alpha crystallin family protein [Bacteroidota bacterium]MBL6943391.1 Hsp20/alpha crystallin family protein [Bacteroidales bacterium]
MNLVRFNPASRHIWHPGFSNFFENFEKTHNGLFNESKGDVPSVNIIENEKNFVIEFAAPGVKKDDFKINLDNNVLTVSKEVKEENEDMSSGQAEKKESYTRREFVFNSFSRSFTLPKSVKFDDIAADYNQGILKVTLPKMEEEAKLTREIKIS